MATISDVAAVAGVSKATVSRVLNGLPVRRETYDKVQRAMDRLGYHPNAQARGLTLKRANTVGVLVPEFDSPFYGPILDGVHAALAKWGYQMLVSCVGQNITRKVTYVQLLRERKIDGALILTPREVDVEPIRTLAGDRFPVVLIDGMIDAPVSSVVIDNFDGSVQATRHLITRGHSRIALLSGPVDLPESQERVRGYSCAMQEAGLEPHVLHASGYSAESGVAVASQLLAACSGSQAAQDPTVATRPGLPTALFCASDSMAIGVMQALYDAGIRVPDDVSIVGFDDVRDASLVRPALTTVRQPMQDMGAAGAAKLLRLISGEETGVMKLVLRTELVVRQSSGSPRQTARLSE